MYVRTAPVSSEDQPRSIDVEFDKSKEADLTCTFSASNPITVFWFKEGQRLYLQDEPYTTRRDATTGSFRYGLTKAEKFGLAWNVEDKALLNCEKVQSYSGIYKCRGQAFAADNMTTTDSAVTVNVFCKYIYC